MSEATSGWQFDLQRGPEWILINVRCSASRHSNRPPLAKWIWSALERHMTYRLLLEFDGGHQLNEYLIRQLIVLDEQVHDHGGVMRLCGLSAKDWSSLNERNVGGHFPQYLNRHDAVFACALPVAHDQPASSLSPANTKPAGEQAPDETANRLSDSSGQKRTRKTRKKESAASLAESGRILV